MAGSGVGVVAGAPAQASRKGKQQTHAARHSRTRRIATSVVQTIDTLWTPCLESGKEVKMIERRSLGHLSREPLYNTRAVVQLTEVPADTFRAWERRYGLPRPHRTPGNQRLYSERDIGVIGWLRDRTGEGMTISQAIQRLRREHPDVLKPESAPLPPPATHEPSLEPQLLQLRERLVVAATEFDSLAGERVIDEALALFTLEEVCTRVITPVMIDIGERWSRNEVSIAVEHFATRLISRRLATIFNLVTPPTGRGTIVAACAPHEEHEVGLLILSIFLARRNWRVIYLGANVPERDLLATVQQVGPDLVCLSASTVPAARQALNAAASVMRAFPRTRVACGGRAFSMHSALRVDNGALYLPGDIHDTVDQIEALVDVRQRAPRVRTPQ
jgi:DNA-binding transcriptional MerR regulator